MNTKTNFEARRLAMNGKQIEKEVIRYLGDDHYRYAILIEGEWGCGKTYFVLNDLQNAINAYETGRTERKFRYISLYGCKSTEEIEENLYWSIIDEQFYAQYKKFSKIGNFHGKVKKKKLQHRHKYISKNSKLSNATL